MNFDISPGRWTSVSGSGFGEWATTTTTWGSQVEWLPTADQLGSVKVFKETKPDPPSGTVKALVCAYRDGRRGDVRMLGATEPVEAIDGTSSCLLLLRLDDETRVEWLRDPAECDRALMERAAGWCSAGYEEIGAAEVAVGWTGSIDERWASDVFLAAGSRILGRSA